MRPKIKILLVILLILTGLAGDILQIFYSWIYSDSLQYLRAIMIMAGPTGAFFLLFRKFIPPRSISLEERSKWPPGKQRKGMFILFLGMGLIVGNLFWAQKKGHDWNEYLYNEGPRKEISGYICDFGAHYGKNRTTYYAIVRYSNGKESFEQEFVDNQRKYYIGDSVRLIYSEKHPLLIKIIQ